MKNTPLYWSRKGEILCVDHVLDTASPRWTEDGWQAVPEMAGRRVKYQCQVCGRRAIQHQTSKLPERPHILNVDDRPASLYARDRVLRGHGFTVTNADTGHSALHVARQLQPNLILLDVHLPDIDGRDLCHQVKNDSHLAHIPVVLISATLNGAPASEVLAAVRADGFINEPVEPAALAGILRSVLNGTVQNGAGR
jgi:CheY-like chemotaxis protein